MMIRPSLILVAVAAGTALVPYASYAEGNLLWKATSAISATVVPAYTNQVSPFPQVAVKPPEEDVVDEAAVTEALAEQKRLRDEAFNRASHMLRSGAGFQPVLSGLRVGGMLDGRLGPRVLLNNQWVGTGSQVPVRQARTQEMIEALRSLKEYDTEAAEAMADEMDATLRGDAYVKLTVKTISQSSLTLAAPSGKTYNIPFSINNK